MKWLLQDAETISRALVHHFRLLMKVSGPPPVQVLFVQEDGDQPRHGKQYRGDGEQAVHENGGRLSRKQRQQIRKGQANDAKRKIGQKPDQGRPDQHLFRPPLINPLGIVIPAREIHEEKQPHDGVKDQRLAGHDEGARHNQQPQDESDQHIQAKQTQTESPDFFQIIISFLLSGNVCIVSDPYLVNSFSFHCTKGWLPCHPLPLANTQV